MTNFTFRAIKKAEANKLKKAKAQQVKAGKTSPFLDNEIIKVVGAEYLIANEDTDNEAYFPAIIGEINGVTTYIWLSMLLKTPFDAEKRTLVEFVDENTNLNYFCVTSKLALMDNETALTKVMERLTTENGTKSFNLLVKKVLYKTLSNGVLTDRQHTQLIILKETSDFPKLGNFYQFIERDDDAEEVKIISETKNEPETKK